MRVIADLHLHSRFSRGCSRDLTLENIDKWCRLKGIKLVSTGDFTHPQWFKEIKEQLMPAELGFYKLKNSNSSTRFILGTEISCIYSQGGKTRRVHVCLLVPDVETVEKIIADFQKRGFNIKSDGRPIIGCSAKNLAQIILEINDQSLVIPAHAWTPWFAVFGSKSGFDSLEECFEELTPQIYAVETGLSSDPPMNWRLSALDNITLISNSDAHSPANLGREANVFDFEDSNFCYSELRRIIKEKDKNKFFYTIEFFPEEGKYHVDGHAACRYFCLPTESQKNDNLCPVCKKPLTLGVLNRVNALADKVEPKSAGQVAYKNLIPLTEIIANSLEVGKNSKKVQQEYFRLTNKHSEFEILIDLNREELAAIAPADLVERIINMREGRVEIIPGYDGIYGQINIKYLKAKSKQANLL